MKISTAIKTVMARYEVSAMTLSKRMGVSRQTLYKSLNESKQGPTLSRLIAIAAAIDCPLSEIIIEMELQNDRD